MEKFEPLTMNELYSIDGGGLGTLIVGALVVLTVVFIVSVAIGAYNQYCARVEAGR